MQLELYFAKQKTISCFFMQMNVSLHHVEFSGVSLKLINITIVTELLAFVVLQLFTWEKVNREKTQQKQSFTNVLQIGVL